MRGYARLVRTLVPAIAVTCTPADIRAQTATDGAREGWIVGGVLGMPGVGMEIEPSVLTVGVVATHLVPKRGGLEVAVGTVPQALASGFFVLGVRGGVAMPVVVTRSAFLIPTAGVSAMGGAGSNGAGGALGAYAGLSTVLAARTVGFRAGITFHRIANAEATFWLFELGLVRVPAIRMQVEP